MTFSATDMWAMYAPLDCAVFETVVRHYVARAEAFGFTKRGGYTPLELRLRNEFANKTWFERRAIAGALGIQSIFSGMHAHRGSNGYDPKAANWQTRNTGDESYEVRPLSLTKWHGHSW